ncbi:response regulator transcription factor, partial [Streptomyces smaragdinus]|uniref:response regulator transcription factor n=1 Tax=Streptomyces smaragdinus TaxID=2585196 RepID=UPI00188662EF
TGSASRANSATHAGSRRPSAATGIASSPADASAWTDGDSRSTISPRELEVARLLVEGLTNRQIADALVVSVQTIASQVKSAMRKLDVTSRTALAVKVVESGLVGPPESTPPRDE